MDRRVGGVAGTDLDFHSRQGSIRKNRDSKCVIAASQEPYRYRFVMELCLLAILACSRY